MMTCGGLYATRRGRYRASTGNVRREFAAKGGKGLSAEDRGAQLAAIDKALERCRFQQEILRRQAEDAG